MGVPFPVMVNCAFGYLHMHGTYSNTPCALATSFFGMTACALATSAPHHHQPSAHMTSCLRSIAPHTSIATIEFTRPPWLKVPPPSEAEATTLPAVEESPTCQRSSLIHAAVVADVDALTISPAAAAAAATSAAAIVSKVSLSIILFHIIVSIV